MVLTKSVSLFEFVSITDSEVLSPDCTVVCIDCNMWGKKSWARNLVF